MHSPISSANLGGTAFPICSNCEKNAQAISDGVYSWLKSVGVPNKLTDEGFSKTDIEKLVNLAKTTPSLDGLLSLAPNNADNKEIEAIYTNSL